MYGPGPPREQRALATWFDSHLRPSTLNAQSYAVPSAQTAHLWAHLRGWLGTRAWGSAGVRNEGSSALLTRSLQGAAMQMDHQVCLAEATAAPPLCCGCHVLMNCPCMLLSSQHLRFLATAVSELAVEPDAAAELTQAGLAAALAGYLDAASPLLLPGGGQRARNEEAVHSCGAALQVWCLEGTWAMLHDIPQHGGDESRMRASHSRRKTRSFVPATWYASNLTRVKLRRLFASLPRQRWAARSLRLLASLADAADGSQTPSTRLALT
jgi:hypothetical protein